MPTNMLSTQYSTIIPHRYKLITTLNIISKSFNLRTTQIHIIISTPTYFVFPELHQSTKLQNPLKSNI